MKVYPVTLPDHYSEGKHGELFAYHFVTNTPHVRHNIVLKQNLICIVLEGTKEVFGSHSSLKINNNEILLMSAGSSIMIHSTARKYEKLESLLFFFSDEVVKEFCARHRLDFSKEAEINSPIFSIEKDDFLLNFEASLKLIDQEHYQTLQKLKLEELLVYLALKNRSGKFYAFVRNILKNKAHEKLRHVVAANCSNGLSIEELAFLCNMSTSTFKRNFMKAFSCSPKQYLTDKKMEKARELLLFNHRPSEIIAEVGYKTVSSFSTEFKKYFGVSPRHFQKDQSVKIPG